MDFRIFDTLRYENARAIASLYRFRRTMKILQFLVLVSVVYVSRSLTQLPVTVNFSCNPHLVFLFGNGIVLALFLLCRQTNSVNNESNDVNRYGETHFIIPSAAEMFDAPPPQPEADRGGACAGEAEETKQIVCIENVASKPQCNEAAATIEKARKQIQKFQRTQSEKLKQEIVLKRQRELRRSGTTVQLCRKSSSSRGETRRAIENLDNEEFRHTVEKFIRKNREMFQVEKCEQAAKPVCS